MKNTIDYQRRINSVINHVAGSLDRAHSIDELAAVANLSKFHFHRIFRAMTGETVSDMVNRLRLESAAASLLYKNNVSITQVAFDHGYSSGANFTKAFSKYFACPPSDYRSNHARESQLSKNGKATTVQMSGKYALANEVDIIQFPDIELAYVRRTGVYDHQEITQMHNSVSNWVKENECEAGERLSIGITWSDSHIASENQWRYDACLSVKKGTVEKGAVCVQQLHASKIARLKVSLNAGDSFELTPYWDWFVGYWLPRSNYELKGSPSFEIYDETERSDCFNLQLCLPLM